VSILFQEVPQSREARARERAALAAQIELLEEEWGTGMERDTLVLLDHACARLVALDEEETRTPAGAL
jgi:hypothetical protein